MAKASNINPSARDLGSRLPATLQERIATYVRGREGVTYVELRNQFPEFQGDQQISLTGNPNIILWTGVSAEFAEAMEAARVAGDIHPYPTSVLVYIHDGGMLQLPVLTADQLKCKTPHWLPLVFNSTPAKQGVRS